MGHEFLLFIVGILGSYLYLLSSIVIFPLVLLVIGLLAIWILQLVIFTQITNWFVKSEIELLMNPSKFLKQIFIIVILFFSILDIVWCFLIFPYNVLWVSLYGFGIVLSFSFANLRNLVEKFDPEIINAKKLYKQERREQETKYLREYQGISLANSECEFLQELELQLNAPVPNENSIEQISFGFVASKHHVIGLGLNEQGIISLPENFGNLKNLKLLYLANNQLTALPDNFYKLKSLQVLDLSSNQLTAFPMNIRQLFSLKVLKMNYNMLTFLPESLGNLFALKELCVSNNSLKDLPSSLGQLRSLVEFDMRSNPLLDLPENTEKMLRTMEFRGIKIQKT